MLDQTKPENIGGGETPTYEPLKSVQCVAFSDTKERKRNMRYSMGLGLKNIGEMQVSPGETIAIVCGGPSLNKTHEQIKSFKNIMVCGSSHDHAIRLGIKPTLSIECDPDPRQVSFYQEKSDATYLVSSRCHRSMFKHLKYRELRLWHMWEPDIGKPAYKGQGAFICGATVALAAIPVALTMGYHDMHFFGFDSCFDNPEEHHAYPCTEYSAMLSVRVGHPETGKQFLTTATWAGQAQQYQEMRKNWGHLFRATVHGDGLIAEIEKQGAPSV